MRKEVFGNYKSFWIANNIIDLAKNESIKITHLHLQKLIYFLHGHYISQTDRNLVEEQFQPWLYGPVLESVYHCVKHYGSAPIDDYCIEFDPVNKNFIANIASTEDKELYSLLPVFWNKYKNYSNNPFALVELSHEYGGAWYEARQNNDLYIDNDKIKEEFSRVPLDYPNISF